MERRALGRTGISVSALAFGCGAVGGLMVRGERADQARAWPGRWRRGSTTSTPRRSTATAPRGGEPRPPPARARARDRVVVGTKVWLGAEELDSPGRRRSALARIEPGPAGHRPRRAAPPAQPDRGGRERPVRDGACGPRACRRGPARRGGRRPGPARGLHRRGRDRGAQGARGRPGLRDRPGLPQRARPERPRGRRGRGRAGLRRPDPARRRTRHRSDRHPRLRRRARSAQVPSAILRPGYLEAAHPRLGLRG